MKKITKNKTKKTPNKVAKKTKKVATIAKGIDIIEKSDGTYGITGKNAKVFEGATIEKREREYKFDERLVPFHCGSFDKQSNLLLRQAIIDLGKTKEMTNLFSAIKEAKITYSEESKKKFISVLSTVINGFDEIGLAHVYEEDIQAIYDNNLKTFNDFWDAREKDDDFGDFN